MSQHLITQHFHRATKEEAAEQAARAAEAIRRDSALARAEAQIRTQTKAERTRQQVRDRVRNFRKRKVQLEINAGLRSHTSHEANASRRHWQQFR